MMSPPFFFQSRYHGVAQAREAFHVQAQQGANSVPGAFREFSVVSCSGVVDQKGFCRRQFQKAASQVAQGGFVRQVAGKGGGVQSGMFFFQPGGKLLKRLFIPGDENQFTGAGGQHLGKSLPESGRCARDDNSFVLEALVLHEGAG